MQGCNGLFREGGKGPAAIKSAGSAGHGRIFLLLAAIALMVFSVALLPAAASADAVKVAKSFNAGEVSGIAADANGIVWFTQRVGLKLGKLDSATGAVKLYPIPYQTGACHGSGGNPEAILVSSTGDVWFSEIPMMDGCGQARIARFHPDTEKFDEYLINPSWGNGYGGSISIGALGLSEGPDGRIWFNDRATNAHIGSIEPTTGNVKIIIAPSTYDSPIDIAVTTGGKVWYGNGLWSPSDLYLYDEATGTFTGKGVVRTYDLATLATDTTGDMWFTTLSKSIGRVSSDGVVHSYTANLGYPDLSSQYLALDNKGGVWIPQYDYLYRFDRKTELFSRYQPGIAGMKLISVDPQDRLWVSSGNSIVLLSTNQPPVAEAGPAQTIECAGPNGTTVALDGSASSDPDNDTLSYAWTWNNGSASGIKPSITLPLGTHTITLTVDDGKGGTAKDTVTITLRDTIPPVTTLRSIVGLAGMDGWFHSDAVVNLDATDNCSGVKEIHAGADGVDTLTPGSFASLNVITEGSHSVSFFARDNSLNTEAANVLPVKIDKTAPLITATATPAAKASGWNNSSVTVTFTCSDALSGIATCPAPITVTADGAGQVISGEAVDKAGNKATASVVLNIDKAAPAITASVDPAPNANGWNATAVTVRFTCTDLLSGDVACPAPVIVSTEGANQIVSGTVEDKAGNKAVATVSVNVDKSLPTITATATPVPNANGWYNKDVRIDFSCGDTLSGIGYCPAPVVVSAEGANQVVTGTAVDKAGNTATITASVNVDKTAAVVTILGVTNGANYPVCMPPTPSFTVSDNLSGVISQVPVLTTPVSGSAAGLYTYSVTAKDRADNSVTATASYRLAYEFGGFQSSVTLGKPFKKGSTIPVKFALGNGCGAPATSSLATLTLQFINSDTGLDDPISATSTVADAGNSFRYSGSDGIYIYNLSTDNLAVGSYLATVMTDDGLVNSVTIQIKP
jgi:streptogramin lyase